MDVDFPNFRTNFHSKLPALELTGKNLNKTAHSKTNLSWFPGRLKGCNNTIIEIHVLNEVLCASYMTIKSFAQTKSGPLFIVEITGSL